MYNLSFIMIVVGTLCMYFTWGLIFLGWVYLMCKWVFNLFKKLW